MKKGISGIGMLGLILAGPVAAQDADEGDWSKEFRAKASAFVNSLDAEQQKSAMLEFGAKAQWEIKFPGGKRPGVLIKDLNEGQKEALHQVGMLVISEEGMEVVDAITAQGPGGGIDRLWVTLFGDPRKGDFAFRVAEHHLTLVNIEMKEGLPTQLGPILLGSNPAVLFEEEETALLKAWTTLNDAEKKKIKEKGKGASGKSIGPKDGIAMGELSEDAQKAIGQAGMLRARFFSDGLQVRMKRLFDAKGGKEKARVAFYFDKEQPAKRCKDGGRWDFKFGIPEAMLWDFQGSGGHIHMSFWLK